jgi:hypothetical protein
MRSTTHESLWFWIFVIVSGQVIVMCLFLALFINNYLSVYKMSLEGKKKEIIITSESLEEDEEFYSDDESI